MKPMVEFTEMPLDDLRAMAAAIWNETRNHPHHATCECPAANALTWLMEHGYDVFPRDPGVDGKA